MLKSRNSTIRQQLFKLILLLVLPSLVFLGALSLFLANEQINNSEKVLELASRSISVAIDQKMNSAISSLEILLVTESRELSRRSLESLHTRLGKAVQEQEDWVSIAFVDHTGKQLFNTIRPFGVELPSLAEQPFFIRAREKRKVAISGHRRGLITGAPIISIAIPSFNQGGKLQGLLIGSLSVSSVQKILTSQRLPVGQEVLVIDDEGRIIGNSLHPTQHDGNQAPDELYERIRTKGYGPLEGFNFDEVGLKGHIHHSPFTDWNVIVTTPRADALWAFWRVAWLVGGFGLIFIILSFSMAYQISARISIPARKLYHQARALGEGKNTTAIQTGLVEIDEVSSALEEAAKKSRDAIEIRDTFLSVASHELKTPLTALLLSLELLEKQQSAKGESVQGTQRVKTQAHRLGRLVDDLLDVSRISSGKLELVKESQRLDEVVRQIISDFNDPSISVHLEPLDVNIDKSRIEQAVINLVSNAQRYGDGKPIEVKVWKSNNCAFVSVKDNGLGIAPESEKLIFEKFERGRKRDGSGGLGLGLWISREIVRSHGGRISVKSSLGTGSEFAIELPL